MTEIKTKMAKQRSAQDDAAKIAQIAARIATLDDGMRERMLGFLICLEAMTVKEAG